MSEHCEVFEFGELKTVSFECPKCRTEVFYHLDTPSTFGAPEACPTCRETFAEIGNLLAQYRALYASAARVASKMRLRVRSAPRESE